MDTTFNHSRGLNIFGREMTKRIGPLFEFDGHAVPSMNSNAKKTIMVAAGLVFLTAICWERLVPIGHRSLVAGDIRIAEPDYGNERASSGDGTEEVSQEQEAEKGGAKSEVTSLTSERKADGGEPVLAEPTLPRMERREGTPAGSSEMAVVDVNRIREAMGDAKERQEDPELRVNVREVAREHGISLVLDESGKSDNRMPVVLGARVRDLTDEVIERLRKP